MDNIQHRTHALEVADGNMVQSFKNLHKGKIVTNNIVATGAFLSGSILWISADITSDYLAVFSMFGIFCLASWFMDSLGRMVSTCLSEEPYQNGKFELSKKYIKELKGPHKKSIDYSFQTNTFHVGELVEPNASRENTEALPQYSMLDDKIVEELQKATTKYTVHHSVTKAGKHPEVKQTITENPGHAWDRSLEALEKLSPASTDKQ